MLLIISWVVLLVGLCVFAWVACIKGRGAVKYWIRAIEVEESWALGKTLKADSSQVERQQALMDANAAVRSLDRSANKSLREWDNEADQFFIGVVMSTGLSEEDVPKSFELRHYPAQAVVRLSGKNRVDDKKPVAALKTFAEESQKQIDFNRPVQLSGQSFSLYQWNLLGGGSQNKKSRLFALVEWTFQLRDNLTYPIIATVISIGLLGTAQRALFALGVCLIVFLSGACKFVFMHQRSDEADEMHLQNY